MLKASGDAARVCHLMRTTNTATLKQELEEAREILVIALEALVGKSVTAGQTTQASLPTRMGGLGIKDPMTI